MWDRFLPVLAWYQLLTYRYTSLLLVLELEKNHTNLVLVVAIEIGIKFIQG
jgi:hypothetical protein